MEGYIDIHSHILPGIDDGAKDIEQTKIMLNIAYKEGIRTIIATPHFNQSKGDKPFIQLKEYFEKVKNELKVFMPQMEIKLGCEIYYTNDTIDLLNKKILQTMAGSRYVLIEFNPFAEYNQILNGLQILLFNGYKPILAHVERYYCLIKDMNKVEQLHRMGCYIQANASDIIGENGILFRRPIKKLLKYNLIDFIATDSHSDKIRKPKIKKCAEYIKKKFGKEYVKRILTENPNKVLLNRDI